MQHADLILHNGKLHTVDPERPEATAVAIKPIAAVLVT